MAMANGEVYVAQDGAGSVWRMIGMMLCCKLVLYR